MRYGKLALCDSANGDGMRLSLFVSGCRNQCPGCFNQETWDFNYGMRYSQRTERWILEALQQGFYDGLSILGGEPMEPENQEELIYLLRKVHKLGQSIWLYTGFTMEELHDRSARCWTRYTEEMLKLIDVLVDGRFIQEKKNISLEFRGSENQRIWKKDEKGEWYQWR